MPSRPLLCEVGFQWKVDLLCVTSSERYIREWTFSWFSLQSRPSSGLVYNVSLIRELGLRNMPFLCGKEIRMIFCAKQTFPKDYLIKRRLSRYSKQRNHSRGLLGHENLLEAFKAQKTFSKSSGIEDLFQSFLSDE